MPRRKTGSAGVGEQSAGQLDSCGRLGELRVETIAAAPSTGSARGEQPDEEADAVSLVPN